MITIKMLSGDKVIFNTFPSDFAYSNLDKKSQGRTYQYIKKNTNFGSLEVFVYSENKGNEERFIRSKKSFNSLISLIESLAEVLIKSLKDNTKDIIDEYFHNIVKINGNQKSIIERFTYFESPKESYNEFVQAVEQKIKSKPDNSAKDICELAKEIRLMDYHIGGYQLLNDKQSKKSITKQNLSRFLLGLSHQFFNEFSANNIYMDMHKIQNNIYCFFEYETFNIAMHNFLQNAVKYAKPSSSINVLTNDEKRQVIFSMDSVRIEKTEVSNLYEKGTFGINTPQELRGSGIGMNTLKKAIERSNIWLDIDPDYEIKQNVNGVEYVRNIFRFNFPINSYQVM